ncbi:MAG: NRDE family protein [Halanaeroarchaeum sp.]
MCTILLAFRQFEEAPVVVAANRDESAARPARPPRVVEGDPAILMPRDEREGGTWMGVNDRRLFAIVANLWTDDPLDGERSRGLLVRDVLAAESVDEARSIVRSSITADRYDGFALLVATPSSATAFRWDGRLRERDLDPGIHVDANVGIDGEYSIPPSRRTEGERRAESADRLRATLEPAANETARDWRRRAGNALGDHDSGACIHRERYHTVSSSLVEIDVDGRVDWQYADGPPCSTVFRGVDGQI